METGYKSIDLKGVNLELFADHFMTTNLMLKLANEDRWLMGPLASAATSTGSGSTSK